MEPDSVYIELNPHDVNFVNRILESYEYLGTLTTIDPSRALCCIHSTADTKEEVTDILGTLCIPIRIVTENDLETMKKHFYVFS